MGIEQSISRIINSPATEPLMGAGLGFMAGGPAGAGMGAMLGSGNRNLQSMAPLIPGAAQALGVPIGTGMGSQQQSQPSSPSAMTQQRPMPAPQQMQPNMMPQPLPPIARQQVPSTGSPGMPRNLPPQVMAMLGL